MAEEQGRQDQTEPQAAEASTGGGPAEESGSAPKEPGTIEPGRIQAGDRAATEGRSHANRRRSGDRSGDRPQRGARGRGARAGRRGDRGGDDSPFEESVVKIYRCSTVVRGGRRFSFSALVVVGDRKGQVGVGYGKDNEVPGAVEKGVKAARKNLIRVNLAGNTIPHPTRCKFGASEVVLIPATPGTGVIAGSSVRPVMELAGIHDVLTKRYGSSSPKGLVKAAFQALRQLRTRQTVEDLRGVKLEAV